MRLGLLALPLLALSLACSFDSVGEPEAGSDEQSNTGSETNADATDDELGTDQGTTSESGDGDGDPTSDTSSDDTTSETTESTSDTDTTDTTESTTDDATETTDATDTETSTETTTESTETGMMEDPYYANCPGGNDDCVIGEVCKQDIDLGDDWQVCALLCENSGECPPVFGHPLTCISYGFQPSACHIDCDNTPCPLGMSCKSVNLGIDKICAWD